MFTRLIALALAILLHASGSSAQPAGQSQTQFTFYYDYTVLPGKEAAFLDFVKTVGGPVRDKLMADGVITEWGVERPLLRAPEQATHSIWFAVNGLQAVGTVQAALADALAKPVGLPGKSPDRTQGDRAREMLDVSRTRDWLIRDLENGFGDTIPPLGSQPWVRYVSYKVKPGMAADFRRVFDIYDKPLLDALVKDGIVEAWGLSVEELKTTGDFTHLLWYVAKSLAGMDTCRAFIDADRARRSQEERDTLRAAFVAVSDPDAERSRLSQIVILRMAGQK